VAAAYRRYRIDLPDDVVERLAACRASVAIDHPGPLEASPLSVSVVRFVLGRVGPALVMLNDYPFLTSEEISARIRRRRGASGFDDGLEPPRPARPVRRRAARPGEVRAIRVRSTRQQALEEPDLALDVHAVLERAPALAQRWAALLIEAGAMDDAAAARVLRVDVAMLEAAADWLDGALRALDEG
jgi:hypothetical protein